MKYPVCSISFKVHERDGTPHVFSRVKASLMTLISGPLECAPDLSDPMSVATYAAEEISEAKDGFVRYFSDEEGMKAKSTRRFSKHVMWP